MGFSAFSAVARLRQEPTLRIAVIDTSKLASNTSFIDKGSAGTFDQSTALKTAKIGGGAGVWGGSISKIDEANWFKCGDLSWKDFYRHISKIEFEFEEELRRPSKDTGLERLVAGQGSFLESEAKLSAEHHVTLQQRQELDYEILMLLKMYQVSPNEGSLLSIHRASDGAFVLRFSGLKEATVTARNLVFAAGPLGNALLVNILTNVSHFSMGNHVSRSLGNIRVARGKRRLKDVIFDGTGRFATLHLPDFLQIQSESYSDCNHNGIRIAQPWVTDHLSATNEKPLKGVPYAVISKVFTRVSKLLGIYRTVGLLQMLDTGLQDNGLVVKETYAKDGNVKQFKLETQLQISQEATEHADFEANAIADFLSNRPISVNPSDWSDAAHYFGTVPVSNPNPKRATVNSRLELSGFPNVWVVGSSSFQAGSHGHPTLLAMKSAAVAADDILSRNSNSY